MMLVEMASISLWSLNNISVHDADASDVPSFVVVAAAAIPQGHKIADVVNSCVQRIPIDIFSNLIVAKIFWYFFSASTEFPWVV